MLGSAILEVAIGLIFIYTVLAVVSSMIQERIAQIFSWRANMLEEGIERLLLDPDVRKRFYAHPLIKSLGRGKGDKVAHPAYIPCQTFTTVVWDVVNTMVNETPTAKSQATVGAAGAAGAGGDAGAVATSDGAPADPMVEAYNQILATAQELPEGDFRTTILAFLRTSGHRVDVFKENVENWFDHSMDRVSSWYKQKAHAVVLVLAFTLTTAGNIDSIELANTLWSEPVARQGLATLAEGYAEGDEAKMTDPAALNEINEQLASLDLTFGWKDGLPKTRSGILSKILGLLLSTFAVSLGAPFWFDVLKNAVRLSGTYRALPRQVAAGAAEKQ